ncbi:LacI family DNA-binding transcriptional regulator [Glutamicibacter sp. M10]|uniref:LacI family DNA-binding transcriptional regulator n=1 Tax=Glutamicibacter sp. M10 TaxID=3023076 RepID=UPI0021C5E59E|nr:LacI family DNA-binding transcriptional regulator [Glutamicibacter sp. M10]UXN33479.1 LacI family transcriptional regulator [Glutamicibacter sp. M10]
MSDVAARAGVSHQTVSRVLNNPDQVRLDTRERVQQAIDELGYRRNGAARALATARSRTIGILTIGNAHFGPSSTVNSVESAARSRGYFVSVSSLESSGESAAHRALAQLVDQGVDGIIVVAPLMDVAQVVERAAPSVPVVVAAANPNAEPTKMVRYVCVDQRAGARLAVEYLIRLGHRKIAHVSGLDSWIDASERLAEFRNVANENDIEALEFPADGWAAADGYAVGLQRAEQIRSEQGPTAIFAANDYIAQGLLRAFWECGIRVPQDISVIGFDDVESSEYFIPSISTVRQPFDLLGQAAMEALTSVQLGDAPTGGRFEAVLEPELIVRGSCAPAPARKVSV